MKASPSQILKEAESLKTALSGESLSCAESWQKRQELCLVLETLLLIDLDYALDKKVEQDLWSFVFRNPISACQSKAKEHKKSNHGYSDSQLSTLFKTASGFYLQLLQKICCAYDLDLPCHPRDSVYGLTKEWVSRYPVAHQPRKSSLLYICQHCLVHLGDLARYRGQSLQAENFYRHAVDLVASNGQPYNQLALLEAASGEKLSTVFFYMRSLSVQHPFPLAATNLQNLFSKMSSDSITPEGKSRMSPFEYITVFLKFQAAVHAHTGLKAAEKMGEQLSTALPALIIAEKFETWNLVQMATICLFAVEHAWGSVDSEKTGSMHDKSLLTPDELKAAFLIEELLASMLYAFVLPVHASQEPKETAAYYTVPAVKIILDWLLQDPTLLQHEALTKKPQVWHGLCKLLNDLSVAPPESFDAAKFEDVPLPEDWDLQCFLPLKKSQRRLKFSLSAESPSEEEFNWLRCVRLCKSGEFLTEEGNEGLNVLSITRSNDRVHFKAVHQTDALSEQVLQQFQELTVTSSPATVQSSEASSSLNNTVSSNDHHPAPALRTKSTDGAPQQEVRFKLDDAQQRKEKMENEREASTEKGERRNKELAPTGGRERRSTRQNVAMQAILQQRASQKTSNSFGRTAELTKEPSVLQQELVVRQQQTCTTNHIDAAHHHRTNQESPCVTPQVVQEVNLNRTPIRHLSPEQYNQRQQQTHVTAGTQSCDRSEPWIQSFNMHSGGISTVGQVVRGNTVASYLQNALVPPMVQSGGSDFPFHPQQAQQAKPQQQPQQQQQQITNKPVTGPQQTFLTNPPSMMWNYMGFMAPFQQSNPPSHQMVMQPGAHHQQPTSQQQQQQQQQAAYYMMNSGVQPKIPQMDSAAVTQNLLHSFRSSSSGTTLPQASDVFRDTDLTVHRVWQPDNSRAADMTPGHLSVNQVVGPSVGQAIQAGLSSQQVQGGSNSMSSSHDIGSNTYSLFNSPWPSGLSMPRASKEGQHHGAMDQILMQPRIQSLWSGPGPSPLERLLEQQKQRRDSAAQ